MMRDEGMKTESFSINRLATVNWVTTILCSNLGLYHGFLLSISAPTQKQEGSLLIGLDWIGVVEYGHAIDQKI